MAEQTVAARADGGPAPFSQVQQLQERMRQPAIEIGNGLLQGLDRASWAVIEPHLEYRPLAAGEVLEDEGRRASFLYFPIKGAISIEAGFGKRSLQVALVGHEGLVGASLLLGGVPANRAVVQFKGTTWRVPIGALNACLEKSPELRQHLLLGVNALMGRLSLTALASGLGTIEQRLASWLLTAADCLGTDCVPITHESLSDVLGVRRPSVTLALHALESKRALRSQRGRILVLDRQPLIDVAASLEGPSG
jgi:CRP-like cAMP-binding protein